MLTEGFFKLHFEDQDVKQIGFVINLKVMLDADMFDGAAFAGKPSAVLDIIRQAQLFEISLECFPYLDSIRKVIRIPVISSKQR